MANHDLPLEEHYTKRRKVVAAIVENAENSDDDDIDMDTISICNMIDEQESQEFERSESSAADIRALGDTIRNTLLEINEIREQNRERRHMELLNILNTLINNEKHEIVKTPLQCQTDNRIEHQKTHCLVEEVINETTDHPFIKIENVEGNLPANALRKQESQTTAANCSKKNTEMIVSAKIDTNSIKLMRAKMLEMQRKKMEDRVRKKCIQVKKL